MSEPSPPEVEAESSRPHAVAHFESTEDEPEVGSSSSSDEEDDSSSTGSTPEPDEKTSERADNKVLAWLKGLYDEQIGWVHGKMTVRHWKPVIRSTISAWVSVPHCSIRRLRYAQRRVLTSLVS